MLDIDNTIIENEEREASRKLADEAPDFEVILVEGCMSSSSSGP